MKKTIIASAIALMIPMMTTAHGCPPPQPRHHHCAPHCHHDGLIPATLGFVGGVICGVGCSLVSKPCTVQQTTVVQPIAVVSKPATVTEVPVQTTTITTTTPTATYTVQKVKVWVNGYFIDIVNSDGTVDRKWVPGHYEYR